MPGFRYGLDAYKRLAGNINIIAGPNGSGKSSTARIIQQMIWWKPAGDVEASAALEVQGGKQRIEINASSYVHYDAHEVKTSDDFSYITPREFAGQYMLALHDLVNDQDDDLAKSIIKELNGGVDLRGASQRLGYSDKKPTARKAEYVEYKSAENNYRKLLRHQEEIKEDEKKLTALKEESRAASEANKEKELYKTILNYLKAQNELEALKLRMADYPAALADYKEDDLGTIEKTEDRINALTDKKKDTGRRIAELSDEIDQLTVAHNGKEEDNLSLLKDYYGQLEAVNRDIHLLNDEILTAQTAKADAGKRLGFNSDDDTANELSLDDIHQLEGFTRRVNSATAKNKALKDENNRLNSETDGLKASFAGKPQTTADTLGKGISELSKWLKEEAAGEAQGNSKHSSNLFALIYAVITGIVTAVCTYFFGAWGLLGLLLFLGLFFFFPKREKKENITAIRQKDYEQLGLALPISWESEAVTAQLNELIEELISLRRLNELEGLLTQNERNLGESEENVKEIKDEYTTFQRERSIKIAFEEGGDDSYNTFLYFVNHLLEWQKASTALNKKEKEREEKKKKEDELLAQCNTLMQALNYSQTQDISGIKLNINKIEGEINRGKQCRLELKHQQQTLENTEDELTAALETIGAIYERLQLLPVERDKVEALARQWADYIGTMKQLNTQASFSEKYLAEMQSHALYQDRLEQISLDEAAERLSKAEKQSAEFERYTQEIADIEAEIKSAEAKDELEEALSRRDTAWEQLDEAFSRNMQSLTGSLIVDQLRKEVALNNDNKIFKEANLILGKITNYRYRLSVEDSDSPVFKAIDTVLDTTLELGELSTGTRVQLLLAVRLAYIRSQEEKHNVRLPILADELLANSDDERSGVIIDSLIAISRTRQVFYFTAQSDEVTRWRARLEAAEGIDYEIISLDEKNKQPGASAHRPIKPIQLHQSTPPPGSLSHREYGEALHVAPFRLIEQNPSELPLWYLIEDTDTLYHALSQGLNSWGQLWQFHRRGGVIAGLSREEDWEQLEKKMSLLAGFARLYQTGRGKKITRAVLEQSGAVSPKFIDEVTQLLEEVSHDPLLLLERIREISGFRKSKADDLKVYLLEEEYIDDQPPLSDEQITLALKVECAKLGLDALAAERFINRILG